MTRHKKLSNEKFRENIEFIADIPVITKGRTAQMVKQLKFDKELIENFMKEKEELKHEKKKILSFVGKRLINFYRGKWMKDFIVPGVILVIALLRIYITNLLQVLRRDISCQPHTIIRQIELKSICHHRLAVNAKYVRLSMSRTDFLSYLNRRGEVDVES